MAEITKPTQSSTAVHELDTEHELSAPHDLKIEAPRAESDEGVPDSEIRNAAAALQGDLLAVNAKIGNVNAIAGLRAEEHGLLTTNSITSSESVDVKKTTKNSSPQIGYDAPPRRFGKVKKIVPLIANTASVSLDTASPSHGNEGNFVVTIGEADTLKGQQSAEKGEQTISETDRKDQLNRVLSEVNRRMNERVPEGHALRGFSSRRLEVAHSSSYLEGEMDALGTEITVAIEDAEQQAGSSDTSGVQSEASAIASEVGQQVLGVPSTSEAESAPVGVEEATKVENVSEGNKMTETFKLLKNISPVNETSESSDKGEVAVTQVAETVEKSPTDGKLDDQLQAAAKEALARVGTEPGSMINGNTSSSEASVATNTDGNSGSDVSVVSEMNPFKIDPNVLAELHGQAAVPASSQQPGTITNPGMEGVPASNAMNETLSASPSTANQTAPEVAPVVNPEAGQSNTPAVSAVSQSPEGISAGISMENPAMPATSIMPTEQIIQTRKGLLSRIVGGAAKRTGKLLLGS